MDPWMKQPKRIAKFLPELWPAFAHLVSLVLYFLSVRDFYQGSGDFLYPLFEPLVLTTAFIFPILGLGQGIYGIVRYRRTHHRRYLLHVGSFGAIAILAAGFFLLLNLGLYPSV